ncbi:MAG: hypothetical protein NTV51_14150 [Verrucomicrobia bacterium]|nr:hypothetical protein [Verrucomicrobiota bacterium]
MKLIILTSKWSRRAGLALGLAAGGLLGGAETAKPVPLMCEPGEALVKDSFAASLPKTWRAGKGTWVCEGGVLRGTEVKADAHQAVIRRPLAFTNAVVTFSFRLGTSRQISLSVNDEKEHVCRVIINPKGFVVQKDDHDHDGPDKAVVFARVPATLAAGEWHTAVVEINGAELVAQVDGTAKAGFGAHELLNRPKANLGFTAAGGTAEFRDISIVAAKPRTDWAATKQRLTAK